MSTLWSSFKWDPKKLQKDGGEADALALKFLNQKSTMDRLLWLTRSFCHQISSFASPAPNSIPCHSYLLFCKPQS